jgi:hypothetical protein
VVLDIEAVGRDSVYQVRVFKGRGRRAEARCLMVACCDQVGDVLSCNSESLFQEADDHMRRRAHRIEDVAGVDHKVHIALQDGFNSTPVSLLDVHLSLVSARLGMELGVPGVPQMSIRDVGYADYVSMIPSILEAHAILAGSSGSSRGSFVAICRKQQFTGNLVLDRLARRLR